MEKDQTCSVCNRVMHLKIDPQQIIIKCPYCNEIQAVLTDEETIRECMKTLKGTHIPPTPDSGKNRLTTALEACEEYSKSIPEGEYFDGGGN